MLKIVTAWVDLKDFYYWIVMKNVAPWLDLVRYTLHKKHNQPSMFGCEVRSISLDCTSNLVSLIHISETLCLCQLNLKCYENCYPLGGFGGF